MKVEVTCFGRLREHLPPGTVGSVGVELPSEATVGDVIAALGLPDEYVFAILVDGLRGEHTTPVGEGSEVTLMPAFSGG